MTISGIDIKLTYRFSSELSQEFSVSDRPKFSDNHILLLDSMFVLILVLTCFSISKIMLCVMVSVAT
jgi:hypothetical protein